MLKLHKRPYILGIACGVLVLGAGTGIAVSQDRAPSTTEPSKPNAPASAPDQPLLAAFAVLRRGRDQGDTMPALAVRAVGAGTTTRGGANPTLSRLVARDMRFSRFALPGAGTLCQVLYSADEGAGVTCAPEDKVLEAGVTMTVGGEGTDRVVYGVAPDWVKVVQFRSPSGDTVRTDVVGNGYVATVPAGTRDAVLIGDSQSVSFHVVNP
jgi:hypothetical protein